MRHIYIQLQKRKVHGKVYSNIRKLSGQIELSNEIVQLSIRSSNIYIYIFFLLVNEECKRQTK